MALAVVQVACVLSATGSGHTEQQGQLVPPGWHYTSRAHFKQQQCHGLWHQNQHKKGYRWREASDEDRNRDVES